MINPIILNKNSIERSSSIRSNYYSWLAPITCLLFQVGEWVSDFIPTVIFIAFPQVGEWVSDVILGDREGGMRLLYHPEGESTRFCFTFIFTAKYQNGEDYFVLSLSQEKDYPVIPKQSPAGLRIRSSFHLSRL